MRQQVSLRRGSTGRVAPNNFNEQLAMKEVLSNPLSGAKELSLKG
jgi:filamentous hemagglutinin